MKIIINQGQMLRLAKFIHVLLLSNQAESKEQRAKSKEQRAKSKEQRADHRTAMIPQDAVLKRESREQIIARR